MKRLVLLAVIVACRTPDRAGTPTPGPDASLRGHPSHSDDKHLVLDDVVAPDDHRELLWGDYIDKRGNPAVGWHSHDPVTGNAQ